MTLRRVTISVEHELDADGQRTVRTRATQFMPTPRLLAVPPSQRTPMPFSEAGIPRSRWAREWLEDVPRVTGDDEAYADEEVDDDDEVS